MVCIRSRCLWLSVIVAWAGACLARGDVLVMRDGRLLLGDIRSVNGDQMVLALGGAGSMTVSGAAILNSIRCPDADKPDTFLKAARRAQAQGVLQQAAACYEKSIEVEPATAATSRIELAALRREMTARVSTRVTNTSDARRAEALRLIAEGESELRGARMAQQYDTAQRGPSAKDITRMGENMARAAEEKISRGKAVLADLDAPPENGWETVVNKLLPSVQSQDWLGQNWQWVVGILIALILLLRFIRRTFFG